jgi:transposase InsO family protein
MLYDSGRMLIKSLSHASLALSHITVDFLRLLCGLLKSKSALAAENLFLRKQLGLYQERQVRPRRATDATRLAMVLLGRFFEWKEAIRVVRPETFIGWHGKGFRLFWRWRSRPLGRPRIPKDLRQLILRMSRDNPTWGQTRIAAELCLKLGIQVSPRTIQKYLLDDPNGYRRRPDPSQRWMTFVRNHSKTIVAYDFFVSVTARFRVMYGFIIMEIGTRRLIHFNVTSHPTAAWTVQQFREAINDRQGYRFLIHDRDRIFSQELDLAVRSMGVRVLKTPFRSPQANSYCERLIGSLRRGCLDFLIPMSEGHLRRMVKRWQIHYNRARPHSGLGPGFPEPSPGLPVERQKDRHQIPEGYRVVAMPILGGLHHEYKLEKMAA